jgi:VWFA-related protein
VHWRLAFAGCACAAVIVQADQQPRPQTPTFRAGVRVVEIDAVVRDRDDRFVTGLTKNDFEVFEDDRPQEITAVSMVNLPADRRGQPIAVDGDVAPAASLVQSDDVGRVYVMVLNSLNERVHQIAREFIDGFLGSTDLMAVMNGDRRVTQGLTNDREELRAAVDRYAGTSRVDGLAILKDLAVNLKSVRGRRKAILYIADSISVARGDDPLSGLVAPELARARRREYDDAVQTAVRNNVRIYPIDPGGYLVRFDAGRSIAESLSPGPPGAVASGLGDGMDARILASQTGGIAIVNTGNYRGNFEKIVREYNGYYVIAFYSSAEQDGKLHPVRVRVKDRPELSVRSRNAHWTKTPDVKGRAVKLPSNLSATAANALKAASPAGGTLPLEVFTAVFQGDRFEGSLFIGTHVPGATLNLGTRERIELAYLAVDRWGVTRGTHRRAFTLTLNDSLRSDVAKGGLRLFGRLTLPRGAYQVRVAVQQPNGQMGVAFADVEIPDYTELPLSVSDLILASSHGQTYTTLENDAILRQALPTQPTPRRRFRSNETISVFGEIYNAQWVLTPRVGVTTIIQPAGSEQVTFRDEQILTSGERGRVYLRGRVPLVRFVPGVYRLVIEAYTRDGIPASTSQQMEFEVTE